MQLEPITQVSKEYGVSTRTLRYYEQIGLIESSKIEGYAYRAYDERALIRLRQILVLRKLRIPLKQIGEMLTRRDARRAIEVFELSLAQTGREAKALQTIERILRSFIREIERLMPAELSPNLFTEARVLELIQSLSPKTLSAKEDATMDDLIRASDALNKPTAVRILYLPPMTVAACHLTGDNTEEVVGAQITEFIKRQRLTAVKPDFRRIGFNNPAGDAATGSLGYEAWVSIPDDLPVPAPLARKRFLGGLYAAYMIPFGEFQAWGDLWTWVTNSEQYEMDFAPRVDPPDAHADPSLEEQLNAIHHLDDPNPFATQLDLLVPIRPREREGECLGRLSGEVDAVR